MATQSNAPSASASAPSSTPDTIVPKSYAKGVAMTSDPWEECATLEYGGDRSFTRSIHEQVVYAAGSEHGAIEDQLLRTLALPQCTDAARAFLCQMLALVGSARSVPALVPLLRDPKTTEAARFALEAIPGPEADSGLRGALDALEGNPKAGLIGSLAARRDQAARPALAAIKDNPKEPEVVRDAAARSLAAITD